MISLSGQRLENTSQATAFESLSRGFGVFTTIKVINRQAVWLEEHLERLRAHLRSLNLHSFFEYQQVETWVLKHLQDNEQDNFALKISLFPDHALSPNFLHCMLSQRDLPEDDLVLKLIVHPTPLYSQRPFAGIKTLSYGENFSALRLAQSQGANDVIFLNEHEQVVESSIANLFVKIDDTWLTPKLDSGCLAGITRKHMIQELSVTEKNFTLNTLKQAQEIILTNSLRINQAKLV